MDWTKLDGLVKVEVNMDGMCADDLRLLAELFKRLELYATVKAAAMEHRKAGKIERALYLEKRCDRIYAELPDFARW